MNSKLKMLGGLLCAGMAIGFSASEFVHAQSQYETKQIYRTDLANLPGKEAVFFASVWQPGFRLPLHMHPDGREFTYVMEGEQTFEIDGVGTNVVKAGEIIYTPPNVAHFGRNELLVIRIKDKSQPIMVEVKR